MLSLSHDSTLQASIDRLVLASPRAREPILVAVIPLAGGAAHEDDRLDRLSWPDSRLHGQRANAGYSRAPRLLSNGCLSSGSTQASRVAATAASRGRAPGSWRRRPA